MARMHDYYVAGRTTPDIDWCWNLIGLASCTLQSGLNINALLPSAAAAVVYTYKETQGRSIKLCAEDICHRHLIIVADLLHIGTPRPYARPQRRRCTVYTTREQYRGSRNGIPRMCVGGATAHTSDSRKVCCQISRWEISWQRIQTCPFLELGRLLI